MKPRCLRKRITCPGRPVGGVRLRACRREVAEADVGVGGAERAVERDGDRGLAADAERPFERAGRARARGGARRRRTAGRGGRGRRGRRGRGWRSPRSCPRGPGAWPRRAGRDAARRARTRAGGARGRGGRRAPAPAVASPSAPPAVSSAISSRQADAARSAGRARLAGRWRGAAPRGRDCAARVRARRGAARSRARGGGVASGGGLGGSVSGVGEPRGEQRAEWRARRWRAGAARARGSVMARRRSQARGGDGEQGDAAGGDRGQPARATGRRRARR